MTTDADWYRQAVVYQIYPRSFSDSNADGLGDIKGITSKADYLEALGVDAVWLSPFYPSALADGGYDVDDYRAVDPRLGTLDDMDALIEALHERDIKLIVDIVPNHTGSGHVWFKEALAAGPGSAARDRYIFRDSGPDGGPPSDWESVFGGPAWEQVADGQWYLHLFDVSQPDLNWDNAEVHEEFLKTLRFWSDRGVDGFRVDVAELLKKDMSEPLIEFAVLQQHDRTKGNSPIWDRDEVHEVYKEWRKVFNEYDPPRMAVAEAWVATNRRPAYASKDELGQAFNFDLLKAEWDAAEFRQIITDNLELARESGSSTTWVLSNHDHFRHATRYGYRPSPEQAGLSTDELVKIHGLSRGADPELDAELGLTRARAATALLLALPGSLYLYQGEELGLQEVVDLPDEARQDPTFFRNTGVDVGRDGCRVPLPWTRDGVAFGFGDHAPHLPQPEWFADYAVEVQDEQPNSTLWFYRQAIALRHELQTDEELTWHEAPDGVLHFSRPNGWHCVTNFGNAPTALPAGEVIFASAPVTDELPGATTVWLNANA